jgi:glycosyltransferase involved in cell wall biosynthesis
MHKLFLWIERFLAHYCTDKIITISEQQQFEILRVFKVGSACQHMVVHLGLDLGFVPRVNSSLREQFAIGKNEFVFGIVGRIAWVKNHVLFLEAVQKFVSDCKESKCRFVVVGDGDEALLNSLKKMANATGLGSKVLFVGNQSNPEDIYGMLNCLVLTSKNEGTPLAILEAFASSVPVVATRVGGVPDLLGDSERGLLVEQNAESVAMAMRSVMCGVNAQILKDAKAFVEDGYSIDSLYNNLNHLYKS